MPDGFVLDAYPDPAAPGRMVLWLATARGAVRFAEPFVAEVFVRGAPGALRDLADALAVMPGVGPCEAAEAVCGLEDAPSRVLRVPVRDARQASRVAATIDARGGWRDLEVFDADLRPAHRFFLAKRLWPFARVRAWTAGRYRLLESSKWAVDYDPPPLRVLEVEAGADLARGTVASFEARVARARVASPRGEAAFEGSESEVLERLAKAVAEDDPDVVLTRGGDAFLLPWLRVRAEAAGLGEAFRLGRDPDPHRPRRAGKSYFTYGRIKYQAPSYALHGRVHLDVASSFFWSEAGMHGLVDLARVSNVPMQDVARLGAGTALTAIQIDLAKAQGRLVPWKKNVPEAFKTARELLLADRGGYIFEPAVGLHEDVVEFDFASLYPNVMVKHNISPETMFCRCCDPRGGDGPRGRDDADAQDLASSRLRGEGAPAWRGGPVPQLSSWTCDRRPGFIPTYLGPVVARREHFKRRRKEDPANRKAYQEVCDVYKWLLVTSFGYQGYKNAKFGRIECHEAIGAWGRETLLSAAEVAHDHGFAFVHGIVDSLWLKRTVPGADPAPLGEAVARELGIPFEYQGRYKWIVFLPTRRDAGGDGPAVGALNRYYGCFDRPPDKPSRSQAGQPLDHLLGGQIKVRGVEMRQHSSCAVQREAQERFLVEAARADDAEAFRARLPRALDAARPVLRRVLDGACPLQDLVLTSAVSQAAADYRSLTASAAALRQLAARGVHVPPGDVVAYVVTDAASRDAERKVREARLLRGDEAYDRDAYARLVLRALASLVLPFGLDEDALAARYGEGAQARLDAWAR